MSVLWVNGIIALFAFWVWLKILQNRKSPSITHQNMNCTGLTEHSHSVKTIQYNYTIIQLKIIDIYYIMKKRRHQWKKTFSFGHCPNYLTPLTPIRATWYFFFRRQNSRFESHCGEGRKIY